MNKENDRLFKDVNNYTKFKLLEMLIEKHQDRFKDFKNLETLAEDILKILTICGSKFHDQLKEEFDETK